MGNSLLSDARIKLGAGTIIDFKQTNHVETMFEKMESWRLRYMVDGTGHAVVVERRFKKHGGLRVLHFTFVDGDRAGGFIRFSIMKGNKGLLHLFTESDDTGMFYDTKFFNETYDYSWGGVTKTNVIFFGGGRGLLVVEEKRKNRDTRPFTITVAHYYASIDIGTSTLVDIRVSNNVSDNELVVTSEGPIQHPSSTLLSMFQQVSTTRAWNRMTCPHCAETQTQRESTATEGRNNLLPARLLDSPVQNGRGGGFLNNEDIRGNGNGNIIATRDINLNFYERRQQRMF